MVKNCKRIVLLSVLIFSSCGPWKYDAYFIKIPKIEENLKATRECQNSIATALAINTTGVKYRCYSTIPQKEEKIVKITCEDSRYYCYPKLISSYIPQGCVYLDEQCNTSIENIYKKTIGCVYLLCAPNAQIPDEIVVKK